MTPFRRKRHSLPAAEKARLVARMLDEARVDAAKADQKAATLLAALGIGFSLVLGGQLANDFRPTNLEGMAFFTWWGGALLAAASVGAAAWSLWPRYSLSEDGAQQPTYWGHIARYRTLKEFDEAFAKVRPTTLKRDAHQLWRLSRLVLTKFRLVRASILLAGLATGALGASTIV